MECISVSGNAPFFFPSPRKQHIQPLFAIMLSTRPTQSTAIKNVLVLVFNATADYLAERLLAWEHRWTRSPPPDGGAVK
jgi:hypothetical protein